MIEFVSERASERARARTARTHRVLRVDLDGGGHKKTAARYLRRIDDGQAPMHDGGVAAKTLYQAAFDSGYCAASDCVTDAVDHGRLEGGSPSTNVVDCLTRYVRRATISTAWRPRCGLTESARTTSCLRMSSACCSPSTRFESVLSSRRRRCAKCALRCPDSKRSVRRQSTS